MMGSFLSPTLPVNDGHDDIARVYSSFVRGYVTLLVRINA